jgi:hypothetical protein
VSHQCPAERFLKENEVVYIKGYQTKTCRPNGALQGSKKKTKENEIQTIHGPL